VEWDGHYAGNEGGAQLAMTGQLNRKETPSQRAARHTPTQATAQAGQARKRAAGFGRDPADHAPVDDDRCAAGCRNPTYAPEEQRDLQKQRKQLLNALNVISNLDPRKHGAKQCIKRCDDVVSGVKRLWDSSAARATTPVHDRLRAVAQTIRRQPAARDRSCLARASCTSPTRQSRQSATTDVNSRIAVMM